ncbi:hypothetical protein B0T14DRAFT_571838 [Immersiella caudata]|uniref:Uncharacterized protein n=1 Tax=Immersiella caudata TaxID=314043 RepID=A0AA39WC75_9PEZI|nr:hypothetical protein B0T14DRAFT_571838 [Immersiella caudata]
MAKGRTIVRARGQGGNEGKDDKEDDEESVASDTASTAPSDFSTVEFSIRNPDWQKTVDVAIKYCSDRLAVKQPVTAVLEKMLLYEKGDSFAPHSASEEIPGMFGTMDKLHTCLEPSYHPNTLVVTKGLGLFSRAKQEWDRNIAAATNNFVEFDQAKLRQLLGSDFEHITVMQHFTVMQHLRQSPGIRPAAEAVVEPSRMLAPLSANRGGGNNGVRLPSIGSLGPLSGVLPPPVAGVKQRADGPVMP